MIGRLVADFRTWLATRLADRKGVAAVEFAFILPLMVTLYFGVVETTYAIMANRKVTSVTSTVADLVAQTKTINNAELDDVFAAATAIMVPFDANPLSIVVTSVVIDEDGNATVDWSAAAPGAGQPHRNGDTFDLPEGLLVPYTSLIVAEVGYEYDSFLNHIITDGIQMSDTFYLRPRASDKVTKL